MLSQLSQYSQTSDQCVPCTADNDEPLLSGSGEVSKECPQATLDQWQTVLPRWQTVAGEGRQAGLAGQGWQPGQGVPRDAVKLILKGGVPEALRGEVRAALGVRVSNELQ